ncbi:MAG TPA: tetratricopeptide repeat protein [Kofleriaceae bacterium]|nr:tetratricopeptide repeat protein [Kofleriaceae bacterium]
MADRTQIQLRMGELYEEEVKDDAKAIACYNGILDAVGDDLGALRALDRLYARTGKHKELHDILERELALVEPGAPGNPNRDHLELKFRQGQLREEHLDKVAGAIESYRDILDLDPHHKGARAALEQRLTDDKHKLAAAGILEPIYEQVAEWGRLVEVHEIQLAAEKKDVGRRVALLMRIGELHSKRLGDAEKAFDAYSRCFVEDPAAEGAKRELEELCSLLDNGWRVLVGLYEDALGKKDLEPTLAHELAMKVAHTYESRLENTEKAVEFYRKALSIEPDDLEAMGALEQIFSRDERYPELLEVYRKRVDITSEPQQRLDILFRIASIHEEMLEAPAEAIEAYSEVLGQDPTNLQALRALDRLYLAGKQWQDLGDNLTRQLGLCEDDRERVTLMVRLAKLRETELGEKAAAVETYRGVLELDPSNNDAIRALERLIELEDHEQAIAQILEPIYKGAGDWQKQVAVYEIMARHAFDPQRKIELYHQIAELKELGGDDGNQAFETYARAFREEPRGEQTQAQLDRLARMFDRWRDLVGLYEEVIGKLMKDSSDDELKVQLLFKLARIHELELGADEAAVKTYTRILDVAGGHLDAASAIQAIHERNSDYPALVSVLKKKSELILELPERKRLLYRAAQIQEEILEDKDAAIATFRQVLSIDDVDLPAMDALERLYIQLERWDALKDIYAKKAELAEDPGDKRQLLLVLGQVYDVELKDVAKAIETYQAILDLNQDDLDAILALDRLYGQGERWYEQLQNLERQVELADSSGEIVGLKYRIGNLWQTRLNDQARAIESYREALSIDYAHNETLLALDGLLRADTGEPVLAARVLEPIYEAAGEFARLIEVLEVMVKHAEDPMERVGLLHRIAQLYEARLEQHLEAYNAFARALREDNGNPQTLAHLERLADVTRVWTKLAELYASEADKSLDVPRQVDLLSRLARVYEEELGLPEQAIATYKRILEVEFDNRPAVVALDRLYSGAERWQELSGILRKEIQLSESDEEVLAHQFRLGQVLEQNLADLRGAIEVYREILSTRPDHVATLGALEMMFLEGQHELEIAGILEPLYEAAGEFEKLHKIYEVQLAKQSQPAERLRMFQQLGELAEKKLYDAGRAFTWWGEAVVEDPRSEIAVAETERLAAQISGWEETVNIYVRALERHNKDKKVARDTLLRLARVYEVELRDALRAVETHLRVLEIDPKDPDALAALDRLYEAAGMYEELVEVLRRRIEVTLDGDEVMQLHFRRGAIFADALADLDAALACYNAVLDQESRNRQALEAQEKIFFRREEWKKLYGTYEKMIDVADGDDEMAEIYARMARLAQDALDDEPGAIDMWGRVLDIRGEQPQPLEALADLHARGERWEELVEVLERQVGVTETPEGQIAVYKRLGRVWADKLGRERNALDAWLAADQIDGRDLETLNALAHLYRSTQSWEELSQTLRRIIEVGQITGAVAEDDLIQLYAQLGQLEGDILGRVNDAVAAWRQVIALDPSHFEALAALESLFTREARWEECIEVLEKRALVLDDDAARVDTLLQAAAIWEEKVGDADSAAGVYERVRTNDNSNVIASERLEAIYRSQYKWEQLNEILLERVEHRSDANERIAILTSVAKNYEEEIGDQDAAFVVLQAAFRENYAHENTANQLVRLATATGKWEELLADYTEMVQGLESQDKAAACDLWVKIGRWYGDHLSHVDYAIHSISQALRLNPNHLGALAALADFQRKRGSWGELVETLGKHAALEPDPAKKVELYLSLADLLETQLQDPMQAMAAYQQAAAADPACLDALVALERLYRRHQMWDQLIDVLGRTAELRTDEEEIIRLKREIGQLWDERMLDSGQAIIAYRSVLDTDPSNLHALRALEQLYEKTGQSEQYLEVLEAQLDASPTDAERISLYERMASAWEERFGKLDRASECLEKIVAIDQRNFAAYRELERLYRQDEKWESLVDTYRNHIMAITDPTARIDLYCAMGEIYELRLNDYDRAIESYNDVLTFDAEEPRALDALGRLYERIQEWDRAIDVMSSLVQSVELPGQQVDLYHRIGRITYANVNDPDRAEEYFLRALSIQEGHVPSMESLVKLYSDRGDWIKAAAMMVRAEAYTPLVLDKVRLLYAAARIYLDRLRQRDPAKQYLAAVIGLDPEHVEAAEPLAQLYFEDEDWAPLMPLLDMLVRKAQQEHNRDPRGLNDLYYRTAKTADELGDHDKALSFYKAAYDIDSTYLPTLVGRADLLFKMQDWDGAGKIYQTILVQHRDSQAPGDVVRIYYRLGMVRQNLGERRKALNMFEKALEIDPHHKDTLEAVINIQIAQNDYEAVVHAKRGLMQNADTDEKTRLLDEIGTIYQSQLNNPQKAIAAYLEALDVSPNDHSLLQKVLDLYSATEQWKKAVETIDKFITLEANPVRKGTYYQAAATIVRDKLKGLDESIEYYNNALDAFFEQPDKLPASFLPRALKAFQDIDKILTTKRDWKNQERMYRKMIKRLPSGNPILVDLWHALGEIYRSRLKHFQSAIQAFEVAQSLDPSNKNRGEILAELYLVAGPDYADKAIEQHMAMLRTEPFKYDSYKALDKIYMDTHQYDKRWCLCNTLAFLKKADPEEMQFFEQYKPRGFVKAKQRMTEDVWKKVYHPDENRYISAILGAIWQGAASLRAQPHKNYGLKAKDKRAVETDQLLFSRIFFYTAQVLNVPLPEVYLQEDQPGEILLANCVDKNRLIPAFVVRRDLLQGRSEKEIAFAAARKLCFMRPEHYLKLALPTNTELKTALLSAIVLVRNDFPVPPDMRLAVQQYLPEMQKRIPPHMLEQLSAVVSRFLQAAPDVNMATWGHSVEATSHRAGFIICGDLETAARMVSAEPTVVGGPQAKDKIKELVLYSVSEEYFAVRHHLGLTIG